MQTCQCWDTCGHVFLAAVAPLLGQEIQENCMQLQGGAMPLVVVRNGCQWLAPQAANGLPWSNQEASSFEVSSCPACRHHCQDLSWNSKGVHSLGSWTRAEHACVKLHGGLPMQENWPASHKVGGNVSYRSKQALT